MQLFTDIIRLTASLRGQEWGDGRRASQPSNKMHAGYPPLLTSRVKALDVHGDYSRAHRWLAIRTEWSQLALLEQPRQYYSMGVFAIR